MTGAIRDLLWYFFIYSFAGWCLEVVFTVCRKKKLVNKGFLNSPLCPIYGVSAVAVTVLFGDLRDQPVFLFIGSLVVATFVEFVTGHLLQAIFHQKWWDYSEEKWNADGYVCAKFSLFWGGFGLILVMIGNPLLHRIIHLIPGPISWCAVLALAGLTGCDLIGTVIALLRLRKHPGTIEAINQNLEQVSIGLRRSITGIVERRMMRAYPQVDPKKKVEKKKTTVFAQGNSFYKLIALFFIGGFLGDLIETLFMYIKYGNIVSRSSVIYGDLSIVWGGAIVILSGCLYRYRKCGMLKIFLIGTALGGTYEYACSVISEILFGTIFWDYSKIPFNLGGRINLLYCFIWGLAAVVWLKLLYPALSSLIERIPKRAGTWICNVLIVLMIADGLISGAALMRYHDRSRETSATNRFEVFLDEHYPDERMEKVYPYAKIVR